VPTLESVLNHAAAPRVPRRRAERGPWARGVRGPRRRSRPGSSRRAVVSSFEPAALERIAGLAPLWPRWLNGDGRRIGHHRDCGRPRLPRISVQWRALDAAAVARARAARPRCRGMDRSPSPDLCTPGADRRPRDLRRGGRARRLNRGQPGAQRARSQRWSAAYAPTMADIDRADLVVVGAGTIGAGRAGSRRRRAPAASSSSIADWPGRREQPRRRHCPGAGRDADDVALGRWSIDFLPPPGRRDRFRQRLPRARLPDPRRHRRGRTSRIRSGRDATGRRLAVRWLSAAEAADLIPTLAPTGHRGGSYSTRRAHRCRAQRPGVLTRHAAGRRGAS